MKPLIRERGYRRFEGARHHGGRWWVVARQLLRGARKQRAVIAICILAAFPTVIAAFVMYLSTRLDPTKANDLVYGIILKPWGTFVFALAMAMRVGGGAVADDARAGGFQFYFARPVTHAHYLIGKLLGVTALVALVAAAPPTLLGLVRLALAQGIPDALGAVSLVERGLVLGAIESAVLGCVVVALSSLIPRRGLVQGAFAAIVILPWLIGGRFRDFTRTPWPALASIPTHFDALGRWLFGMPNDMGSRAMPPSIALAALVIVSGGAVWLAWRRLQRAEVVAS